jgi:hypothetical protein
MSRLTPFVCLLGMLLAIRPAVAQDPFAKEEQDLVRQCVGTLSTFATVAKSQKVGQRAKQAYNLVIEYDPENAPARTELGFKKDKGVWVDLPPEKRKKWVDKATYEGRFKVMDEWAKTALKIGEAHRKLGLKMKEAGNGRAIYHLEKAIYYNPNDREANLALGYKEGPGFFGTDSQIAFAVKMKEIETKAVEIARKDYPCEALPRESMPVELRNLEDQAPEWMKKPTFEISGAKTANFTVWLRGNQEFADNAAKWGERALDFGDYLIGEARAKKIAFRRRATGTKVQVFFATGSERDVFLKANPHIWEKDGSLQRAKDFANNNWIADGKTHESKVGPSPRFVQDAMVGEVFANGLTAGANEGMGQGILHAATWYMKSTSIYRMGARPEGTTSDDSLELPEGTGWWMRAVRDQAVSNQDMPADQLPREKLSRFRNDIRLKAWSFTTWLWAAAPDKWLDYYAALPDEKIPTLEEVGAIAQKVFGRPLAELDAEWREWARGDSGVAFGTGYGPPLLPERPSKNELAALDRVNLIRSQLIGYVWDSKDTKFESGKWVPLSVCEMDAEASTGCDLHANYITNHQELIQKEGPDIHEEDPAHEDFTRRGQQAGSGNIVTATGVRGETFAEETVDGWIGTPYHRFPMLEQNIKRLGYSYVFVGDLSVAVLDMGSLREPYDPGLAPRLIAWPPHNSVGIPTGFSGYENPNPLEDQPEGERDVSKVGYPISLQLQDEVSRRVGEASFELFESRKGGKYPALHLVPKGSKEFIEWEGRAKEKPVPCYVHTPRLPLNKKQDLRNVVFGLPKEPLDTNKQFQVRVMLRFDENEPVYMIWEFATGTQSDGLRLKG